MFSSNVSYVDGIVPLITMITVIPLAAVCLRNRSEGKFAISYKHMDAANRGMPHHQQPCFSFLA